MKAIAIVGRSRPFEVIELDEGGRRYQWLYSKIRGQEVEVEVKAVSINPVDWKVAGMMKAALPPPALPRVFGADFSGVVTRVGTGVREFRVGDRVFGSAHPARSRAGAFAERVQVPHMRIARIPDNVSFIEAAALPIAGLTAYQALRIGQVSDGFEILINGGSGGVGRFAIQYAKTLGAQVTATSSPRHFEILKSLGAHECLDYRGEPPQRQFQFIFDAAAKMSLSWVRRLLTPSGMYLATLPRLSLAPLKVESLFSRRIVRDMWVDVNTHDLEVFADLVADKRIQVHAKVFTGLDGALLALAESEAGRAEGKLVAEI